MKNLIATLFAVVVLSTTFLFAEETTPEASGDVRDVVAELRQEVTLRDSLMAVGDSACAAEKDSLRSALAMGNAVSDSWKQSYETMRKDGEACARNLSATKSENELLKEESQKKEEESGFPAAVAGTSFLGGLGIGMLLFWLIFE